MTPKTVASKKKKRRLWWMLGGLFALLVLLLIFSGGEEGTAVAVEEAGPRTITESVTASGKIYPENEVKIAPEASGEIITLLVAEGDSVRKGQLLLRINPAIYSSAVNQAQASVQQSRAGVNNAQQTVAQAQAQFDQAAATYNRNKKLYDDKVISAVEFEQATASYKAARAAYDAARAQVSGGQYGVQGASATLSQAQANLQKTAIIAPVSGIVSSLNVKAGERVVGTAQMAGTELLTIADLSRMEVRVEIGETDIAKVTLGDTAIVEAEAFRDRKFTGIVSRVGVSSARGAGGVAAAAASSADQVTLYTVHIVLLPSSYADLTGGSTRAPFKPGMSASVEIITNREAGVLGVPTNAVTTRDWPDSVKRVRAAGDDDIREVVFVIAKGGKKAALRDVKTGIQGDQYIQILSGLKAGERVVSAPYGAIARTLRDGALIRVVPEAELRKTGADEAEKEED